MPPPVSHAGRGRASREVVVLVAVGCWPPHPVVGLALLPAQTAVLLTLGLLLSTAMSPMASGVTTVGLPSRWRSSAVPRWWPVSRSSATPRSPPAYLGWVVVWTALVLGLAGVVFGRRDL